MSKQLAYRSDTIKEITARLSSATEAFDIVNDQYGLDQYDRSRKLKERQFPYSCTDEEGAILYTAIKLFGLKSGFEIATAFGYSSLFIGMALSENNGKLTSVDCFVEEWKDSYEYDIEELHEITKKTKEEIDKGKLPLGLKYARANRDKLALQDTITYKVGISPDDLPEILNEKIDLAFIDGGHFGDQPTLDFLGIYKKLSDRCLVFFHDNNGNPHVGNAIRIAEEKLGAKVVNLSTRYELSVIGRNINYDDLSKLRDLSLRIIDPRRAIPKLTVKSRIKDMIKKVLGRLRRIYNKV